MATSTRAKAKRILANSALFVASSLAVLGIAEQFLRTGVIHNGLWAAKQPRLEMINQLNDQESGPRIVILGDSFLHKGHSTDQFLSKELGSQGISVINLAHSGYGFVEYLLSLKNVGAAYRPDTILLSFYAGNDLTDLKYPGGQHGTVRQSNRLLPHHKSLAAFGPDDGFYGRYLYRWVRDVVKRRSVQENVQVQIVKAFQQQGVSQRAIELFEAGGVLNHFIVTLGRTQPNHFMSNLLHAEPDDAVAWQEITVIMDEVLEISRNMDSQLVVVVFPNTAQVNRNNFAFYESLGFVMDEEILKTDVPQQMMRTYCEKNGIAVLDLLPEYRARDDEMFYYPNDDHMNIEGSRLAADLIFAFLERETNPMARTQISKSSSDNSDTD